MTTTDAHREDADEFDDSLEVYFDMSRRAVFAPIQTMSAFEETVDRLLSAIKLGVFAVGERLPAERVLADHLQVSRLTLREAIRALRISGYLQTKRGRYGGTFVTMYPPDESGIASRGAPLAFDELDDLLRMRRILEIGAVEEAASLEHEEAELAQAELHLRACEQASDRATFHRTDSRLHLAFAELAHSPLLVASLTQVRPRINEYLSRIPALEINVSNSHVQHQEIFDAIRAGDPAKARRSMLDHVNGTRALLHGFLSRP